MTAPVARPPSASNFWVNVAGGVVFLIVLLGFKFWLPGLPAYIPALAATTLGYVTILLLEVWVLRVYQHPTVLALRANNPRNAQRITDKMTAITAMLLLPALVYYGLPLYSQNYYYGFMTVLPGILVTAWLVALFYVSWFDGRFKDEGDTTLILGRWINSRGRQPNRTQFTDIFLLLLLRGFFIALMFAGLVVNTHVFLNGMPQFIRTQLPPDMLEGMPHFQLLVMLITVYYFFASIDVMFATIGYITTFKATNSHVRSVFRSPLAWIVCIGCYAPFFTFVTLAVPTFIDNPEWYSWLAGQTLFLTLWGSATILLMCFESFSTLSFGIRFSNLSYRGLVTSGMYRFTKHPQYIAKMLNRFAFYMPFFSLFGGFGLLLNAYTFLFLAYVYFLRARTEENHLAQYPEYVEYARYIERHGIFRKFGQWFPVFRFDPARAATNRIF